MMHRNLDRRVEVLVRVDAEAHRQRLRAVMDLALADRTAWQLGPDGTWRRRGEKERGIGPPLQETLMARAGRAIIGR